MAHRGVLWAGGASAEGGRQGSQGSIQVLNLQGMAGDLGPVTPLPGPAVKCPPRAGVTYGLEDTGSQK